MSRALALGLVLVAGSVHAGTLSTLPPGDPELWTKINTSQTPTDAIDWRHRDHFGALRSIIERPTIWRERGSVIDHSLELYNPAGLRLGVWITEEEILDDEIAIDIGADSGAGYLITVTSDAGVRTYNREVRGVPEPSGLALAVCGVLALRRRH